MPYIVTGSSDRHIRMYDLSTQHSWSTDSTRLGLLSQMSGLPSPPTYSAAANAKFAAVVSQARAGLGLAPMGDVSVRAEEESELCGLCGGDGRVRPAVSHGHNDLVRAVAMDGDVVLSASYDSVIKVSLDSLSKSGWI